MSEKETNEKETNEKETSGKFGALVVEYKDAALVTFLGVFLLLSFVAMWREQEVAAIGYILAAGLILAFLFPGTITSLRFGNYEVKLREVQDTVAEARDLAKLMAEIAIPLAHHSEGWADTAPSTVQTKDAVIGRVMNLKDKLGVEISDEILELHYVKSCSDYWQHVWQSLDDDDKSAFHKELGTTMIPTKIEDVPMPDLIENILKKLDLWNDYMETLVEDYRYYYKNWAHRNQSRWNNRAEWKRPASKVE